MNIQKEKTGDLTASLKIEITHDDYQDRTTKQLRDYQKNANFPGFRKGQVPFGHVIRLYGKAILIEEIHKLIDESMQNYLKNEELTIFGTPLANEERTGEIDFKSGNDFVFFFDVAFFPDLTLDLKSIDVDFYKINPDQKMLDLYLQEIRSRFGTSESKESAEEDDIIYGEIEELTEDGELKIGGLRSFASIPLNIITSKEVKERMIGARVDDVIEFPFKDTFDKEVDMNVILKLPLERIDNFDGILRLRVARVYREFPHEMNEDLYKLVFPEKTITTYEEFLETVRENIVLNYDTEMRKNFLSEATKALVEKTEIALPEEFLKKLFTQRMESAEEIEQMEVEWNKNYIPSVKWQIIEHILKEKHNLGVSSDEFNTFLKVQFANFFPKSLEETEDPSAEESRMNALISSILGNQERSNYFYEQCYSQKLTNLLLEEMNITRKEISLDELKELMLRKR